MTLPDRRRQIRQVWRRLAACLCLIFTPAAAASADRTTETKVGLEGVYILRTTEAGLLVRKADERSPVLLRIAGVSRDDAAFVYELRFIGARAGEHDLRDYLARSDGQDLRELPQQLVRIASALPDDHDGSLDQLATSPQPFVLRYRWTVRVVLVAWLMATAAAIAWRWSRHRPTAVVPAAQLTLADQLQPLVEAALASQLDAAGQARLEMLLLSRWRASLRLSDKSPDQVWKALRAHPEAGALLRALEAWLHACPGSRTVNVAELLAPYGAAVPISVSPTGSTS